MIQIDVPDEVVMQRVLNRRLCGKCGLDYNLIFHRPRSADTCDVCGGQLVARGDDTPSALQSRLRDYHAKTAPILELFSRKELIVSVDGTQPTTDVQEEIRAKLDLDGECPRPPRSGAQDVAPALRQLAFRTRKRPRHCAAKGRIPGSDRPVAARARFLALSIVPRVSRRVAAPGRKSACRPGFSPLLSWCPRKAYDAWRVHFSCVQAAAAACSAASGRIQWATRHLQPGNEERAQWLRTR